MRLNLFAALVLMSGCAGADASFDDRWSDGPSLRVGTYNIHHWIGRDERPDVARIAQVINELDLDVLAVQEADNNLVGDGDLRRQELFTRHVHGEWATFQTPDGPTMTIHGNAVFVAPGVDVIDTAYEDVSEPGRDPRAFTDSILEVRGQRIRLVGAHLGLSGAERERQVGKLSAHLAEPADVDGTVVMGDFNEWNPLAATFRPLRGLLRDIGAKRSFPAGGPLFRLDRIFASEHAEVEAVEVVRTTRSTVASDHLPVRAEIVF